jgi:hypothetical protein
MARLMERREEGMGRVASATSWHRVQPQHVVRLRTVAPPIVCALPFAIRRGSATLREHAGRSML